MIFEGYIVNFDEEKFDKIYRLVGSISNNINQIAVRANSTNNVYTEDIVNIKEGQDKIWQLLNSLQYGVLVEYNPDHKIDLKFMLSEQNSDGSGARAITSIRTPIRATAPWTA